MENQDENIQAHVLKYSLSNPVLDIDTQKATFIFDLAANYGTPEAEQTPVVLSLGSQDDMHSLQIMKTHRHKNILQLRMIKQNVAYIKDQRTKAFVEPYSGRLSEYLQSAELASKNKMVPGGLLQDIIRYKC
uniref:Uncharacterized protein n=1 Tax=Leersia perrieri TaxID=77586 RepID=A0A0D9VAR6_9ORYZ